MSRRKASRCRAPFGSSRHASERTRSPIPRCNCCDMRPPALWTCFVVTFLGFLAVMRRIVCLLRCVSLRPSSVEDVRPGAPPSAALYRHLCLVYTALYW
jgi:hypothetical protein